MSIPPVEATVQPDGGQAFPITLLAPEVTVASVLPADVEDLQLRDARGFLRIRSFPWWILLVLGALAAFAWWLWRRGNEPASPMAFAGPGEIALLDFQRLRGDWLAGEVTPGTFYDRYEQALRRYARATRTWSPSRTLVGLAGGSQLVDVLKQSVMVRFARMMPSRGAPDAALDAGEAFVRSEMPEPEQGAGEVTARGES